MAKFKKDVAKLFGNSINISHKKFSYNQLKGLPKPVELYFKNVLKECQPFISAVRLKHNGQFKVEQHLKWSNITGEQYFTAEPPGFVWRGKIGPISAKDTYLLDKGRIVVKFLNAIKFVDGQGASFDQGELLRWLAECVWFPTNLLPSENLKWLPVDSNNARIEFSHNDLQLHYSVKFNDENELVEFETERYFDEHHLKTWIGTCSDYKEIDGIKIPHKIEATWRLGKGDYTYANFNLQEIEYNVFEKY